MVVLSIILGVLLIIGGISCMATPFATYLSTGYFVGIFMFVYGIAGLVRGFQKKAHALEIVVSVLAIIVGIISFVRPGTALVFDGVMLYVIAAWFVIQGIVSIVISFQMKSVSSGWFWGLIVGILGVILGIYSFAHPMVTALTAGLLIGFYFIESGIDLIVLAVAVDSEA